MPSTKIKPSPTTKVRPPQRAKISPADIQPHIGASASDEVLRVTSPPAQQPPSKSLHAHAQLVGILQSNDVLPNTGADVVNQDRSSSPAFQPHSTKPGTLAEIADILPWLRVAICARMGLTEPLYYAPK